MKKEYIKPRVILEEFVLNTNLASNCEVPFSGHAQDVCPIKDDNGLGLDLFNPNAGGGCIIPGGDDATWDGFCYHIPVENENLFNS